MPTRHCLPIALTCLLSGSTASFAQTPAQVVAANEAALREAFQGSRVMLKIDMPGASEGVDIRMDRPFDASRYKSRLGQYGVAIRAGAVATVTLVKIKDDLIEFQLDGGGFGTFGDDTSTTVDMPLVEKSNRERDLERAVRDEPDAARKRTLQRELDDLRRARERENRRINAEKSVAEDLKRRRVAERRREGGSRFNLRWAEVVPAGIRPIDVQTALEEYVNFSPDAALVAAPPDAPPTPDGVLRKGMSRADAERMFGAPLSTSERREGTLRVVTLVFARADERITAEFVEDVLIKYTITSR
jgi:hypothetical protein